MLNGFYKNVLLTIKVKKIFNNAILPFEYFKTSNRKKKPHRFCSNAWNVIIWKHEKYAYTQYIRLTVPQICRFPSWNVLEREEEKTTKNKQRTTPNEDHSKKK